MLNQHDRQFVIKDIARMCNVSSQTVSRVLNRRAGVSLETRHLVQKRIVRNLKNSETAETLMKIGTNSTWILAGDSITACQRDVPNPDDLGKGYVSLVDGLLRCLGR